jgi:hypothetical protein
MIQGKFGETTKVLLRLVLRLMRAIILLLMLTVPSTAQDVGGAESPVKVQIGAYVMHISNVSQKDGTFTVDMWLWFRWKGNAKPYESFDIANGQINNRSIAVVSDDQGFNYTSVRVQATVFHDYDVHRFPLDDHVLAIEIEDENLDISGLEYIADEGIALDPDLEVPGWAVALQTAAVVPHVYPTNYGLRSSGADQSTYSRFVLRVSLTRASYGALLKVFWISALSVLLGLLAFRIKATDLDARFGLGVGSIFAASANGFVISDSLPKTSAITMAEQINFLAIGTIFLSVFVSITSLRLCHVGREEASERLDRWALAVIGLGYLAANVVVIYPIF